MNIKQIISNFQIPIKEVLIEQNLVDKAFNLLDGLGLSQKKILLVSDQNIYPIAKKIIDQLSCPSLILQTPKADQKTVDEIIKQAQGYDLIVAVGSGVINDLCKVASFRLNIPYLIFGTAPSMNGYASANASIVQGSPYLGGASSCDSRAMGVQGSPYLGGASLRQQTMEVQGSPYLGGASLRQQKMGVHNTYKTSIPAHLPMAIYLDLDVLVKAPLRLIKSGIGDSLCFSTCQFDWLLSHLLLGTYYDSTPFDLLKSHYQKLLSFEAIDDENFIQILAETLIISGLGMSICKGSYPASQAEHLIAHYIEILYPQIADKSYHGEQISVCTLSVANLQEQILQQQNLQIKESDFKKSYLEKFFDTELAKHFFVEISKKEIDEKMAQKINQNLQKNWVEIKAELQKTFISKNDLLKSYHKFSLPKNCLDIGLTNPIYDEALSNAHLIRNRFTSLDLIKIII